MAQFVNMFEVDLNNRSYPVSLNQTVSEGNVYSNRIGAYVYKDGAPVNLGGACTGLVMRADGTTVPMTGFIDGNAAYVVLDQPSCAIPGPIQVAVNSVVGENITTLLVAYGTVILTDTRNYVEPGTPIPDITELLAEIDNMRDATASANAAANNALGNFAGAFNSATAYPAGSYVTYTDGYFYALPNGHGANVTWANTTKVKKTTGSELSDLKSALNQIIIERIALENGAYGATSGSVPSNYRIRLATPVQVEKGTVIHFHDGSLYHMIWELSSSSTSGGNVITNKSWNNDPAYTVINTGYIMLSFSKTQGGATEEITTSDFLDYYSVDIIKPRTIASAQTIADATQTEKLLANLNFNLLDASLFVDGTYSHSNPFSISTGNNTQCVPKIRIYAGITYYFKYVYAYFCPILYDDGTIAALSDSASPATVSMSFTPSQNGYVFITVNNAYVDTAMIVEGTGNNQGYFKGFSGAVTSLNRTIGPGTFQSILPDWKQAPANSVYTIVCTTAMVGTGEGLWDDVPFPLYHSQCIVTLCTIGNPNSTGCTQVCNIADKGVTYIRYLNNNGTSDYWTAWYATASNRNSAIVIDKNGGGDFTSFTAGMLYATQFMDAHVYVMPGEYDIISEYTDLYGSDFFTNYDTSATDRGVVLKNNVTVEFAPNASIVCEYTGSNTTFQNYFAPLNSGVYGFTLINCKVTSRNVRYSMHDERNSATDYYHNRYIGCHFDHSKGTGTGYKQTIGGGLGKNGLIEIDNCIFENPNDTTSILSWHNCRLSGARSQIFIRNSIVKGNVRFSWYGEEETLISAMMITGCKMYSAPVETQETSEYNNHNVEIIAWGNDIQAPTP